MGACKPQRNDLKGCQRHRNNVSVQRLVLKCPSKTKNKVKFATHSAEKWVCMGNWARKNLAIYFSKLRRLQTTGVFPSGYATLYQTPGEKHQESSTRDDEQFLAVNNPFWAWSNFNSSANLSGGRHNYKNKLLVQGKQTTDPRPQIKSSRQGASVGLEIHFLFSFLAR